MHLEDANALAESFVYSPISKEVQQFGTFRVRGRKDIRQLNNGRL